jgi:hypothetical protein
MAPLSAASRETVFATSCIGVLVGSATGVLFPTFWRFVSDAILMQDSPTGKVTTALCGLAAHFSHGRADGRTWSSSPGLAASPEGEAEMDAKQGNAM